MWSGVDEIGECYQGRREANGRAVQSGDENLRMGVECVGYVQVVANERPKPVATDIRACRFRSRD